MGKPGHPAGWTAFQELVMTPRNLDELGLDDQDREALEAVQRDYQDGRSAVFINSQYTVSVTLLDGGVLWLAIRRNDRREIRDWRHLQRIKNELVGPEREALEIYPAESRRVDTGEQVHLWVMPAGSPVPFGFNTETGESA